jgi:hypothetical protein
MPLAAIAEDALNKAPAAMAARAQRRSCLVVLRMENLLHDKATVPEGARWQLSEGKGLQAPLIYVELVAWLTWVGSGPE